MAGGGDMAGQHARSLPPNDNELPPSRSGGAGALGGGVGQTGRTFGMLVLERLSENNDARGYKATVGKQWSTPGLSKSRERLCR